MKTFRDYGPIRNIETPHGNHLEILPTCDIPDESLMEEYWDLVYPCGNTRYVRTVEQFKMNGIHAGLFIKSPERIFTTKSSILSEGTYWWGKRKSGEIPIRIDHPLVEAQIEYETLFLLELMFRDIPAERPLAIVTYRTGYKELIVKKIKTNWNASKRRGRGSAELRHDIEKLGLIPEDYGDHNAIVDPTGLWHVIDVNRWSWPTHTNVFHTELLNLVRSRVKR